jgi:hypothetical protein
MVANAMQAIDGGRGAFDSEGAKSLIFGVGHVRSQSSLAFYLQMYNSTRQNAALVSDSH